MIVLIFYDKQILYKIPGGKSDFDNKSKIFILGSYEMSRIRLWILISKCSRESLSTWGERNTQ